jgi:hypothetical protein
MYDSALRYTSFTGCAILLFGASQKLLLLSGAEIDQDLLYASSHMNLLSLCSSNSSTARVLYTMLQLIYNDVREIVLSATYRSMRDLRLIAHDVAQVPDSYFDVVPGSRQTTIDIRDVALRAILVLQDKLYI